MTNAERFDNAIAIVSTQNADIASRIKTKREKVLTGFGIVKSEEKQTRTGINFGAASVTKAAKWAGLSQEDGAVLTEAWGLSVALEKAGKAE